MKKTLGIILIVLGLCGLAWGGFTYTTKEKVLDVLIYFGMLKGLEEELRRRAGGGPEFRLCDYYDL